MEKEKVKRTIRILKDRSDKLNVLKNYLNSKSVEGVLEQLIENAYLRMNEDTKAEATEELKETSVQMAFKYQELAMQLGDLKEENGILRAENSNLKESLEKTKEELSEQKEKLEKLKIQVGQLITMTTERDKNNKQFFKEINEWIKAKDKSFISKVKNFWE